jgi:hypothetical protein
VTVLVVACLVLTAANLVVTAVLFRQLGLFVMGTARGVEDSGIPPGRRFPDRAVVDVLTGRPVRLAADDRAQLVFFGSTDCRECRQIYPDLVAAAAARDVRLVHVLFGEEERVVAYAGQLGLESPVVVATQELGRAYDVEVSPFCYAIGADGVVVGKGLLNTRQRLQEMVGRLGPERAGVAT